MTPTLRAGIPNTLPTRKPALRFGHTHGPGYNHTHDETGQVHGPHCTHVHHPHHHAHQPASPSPTETTPKSWLRRTMSQIALFLKELFGGFFKDVFGGTKHPPKPSHAHPH
jgi:hypothetical protein